MGYQILVKMVKAAVSYFNLSFSLESQRGIFLTDIRMTIMKVLTTLVDISLYLLFDIAFLFF
jgi:hypothetical protein